MKKIKFLKLGFPMVLLWFLTVLTGFAQTPSVDLDSITEDSYRRMLERQKTEQNELNYPNFISPAYDSSLETYTITDVPSPRGEGIVGSISDPKDILDAGSEQRINKLLYELEQKSSVIV